MTTSWNPTELDELGRQLGHDLHLHSLLACQPDWPAAVRQGFEAAFHAGARRRRPNRFTAKWLQLRLGALKRGRAVAADVTPQLLVAIDVDSCPVTRQPLTHGTQADSDWSVDRLNNDAAYAASNLAVMSVRANRAKGALPFDVVLERAARTAPSDGLSPAEWQRLAALMHGPCFAARPQAAPLLPLCAPLPARSARLATQQLQRLLTLHCARPAGKNKLLRAFARIGGSELARTRLQALGDAVHDGLKQVPAGGECWDVWLQPRAMAALARWLAALDELSRARAAAVAGQLSQARRETAERLRSWQLPTAGYLPAVRPLVPQPLAA